MLGAHPAINTSRRYIFATLACAFVCWAIGCQSEPKPIDPVQAGVLDEPFPHASATQLKGDFNRLVYDIPRAVKKHHWGMLNLEPFTANKPGEPSKQSVRAQALLPDDRTASLIAWRVDQNAIGIAMRVGHFGDPGREHAFFDELARVLRGKPSRRHRQGFELPPPN